MTHLGMAELSPEETLINSDNLANENLIRLKRKRRLSQVKAENKLKVISFYFINRAGIYRVKINLDFRGDKIGFNI